MHALIEPSPALTACFYIYFGVTCAVWCFGTPRIRAATALSTVFTFGVRTDLGVAFDAYRCLGVLSALAYIGSIGTRREWSFRTRLLSKLAPFIIYSIFATCWGVTFIEGNHEGLGGSFARNSTLRPFARLGSLLACLLYTSPSPRD